MPIDMGDTSSITALLKSGTLPKYQWHPLQTIDHRRLIHVRPSDNFEDPIVISISEYAPDQIPDYFALSYHWGDLRPRHDIAILPGFPTSHQTATKIDWRAELTETANLKRATIHDNLFHALRRLRDRKKTVTYWTDSLCLNQTDNAEKSVQIQRMARVYSDALHVTIHLGEHNSESDESVFKTVIDRFSQHLGIANCEDDHQLDITRLIKTMHYQWSQQLHLSTPHHTMELTFGVLQSFFGRPWFDRVWVVQEIFRAYDDSSRFSFVLGTSTVSTALVGFLRLLVVRLMYEAVNCKKLISPTPVLNFEVHKDNRLIHLLRQSRMMRASDPRDHCFGVLPVSEFALSDELRPNYNEPVRSTFKRYTKFLIPLYGPEVLFCCVKDPDDALCLPSWAPNWSSLVSITQPVDRNVFYITGGAIPEAYALLEGDVLRAPGMILDRISVQSYMYVDLISLGLPCSTVDRSSPEHRTLRTITRLYLVIMHMLKDIRGQDLTHTVAYRYLMSECSEANGGEKQIPTFCLDLFSTLQAGRLPDMEAMAARINASSMEDLQAMIVMTMTTYVCITDKGDLAKVPGNFELGDVIGIAQGCGVPFLLRPVSEKESAQYAADGKLYRIIGHAYVYGMMHGEAFANKGNKVEHLFFI